MKLAVAVVLLLCVASILASDHGSYHPKNGGKNSNAAAQKRTLGLLSMLSGMMGMPPGMGMMPPVMPPPMLPGMGMGMMPPLFLRSMTPSMQPDMSGMMTSSPKNGGTNSNPAAQKRFVGMLGMLPGMGMMPPMMPPPMFPGMMSMMPPLLRSTTTSMQPDMSGMMAQPSESRMLGTMQPMLTMDPMTACLMLMQQMPYACMRDGQGKKQPA